MKGQLVFSGLDAALQTFIPWIILLYFVRLPSINSIARLAQSVERETLSFHVLTRLDWLSQGCGFDPHVGLIVFVLLLTMPSSWLRWWLTLEQVFFY